LPEVESYLLAILSGERPAESRQAIADKFGVSKGMLEHAFKVELQLISEAYKEHRRQESLKAKDSLQYEMNKAVQRCLSRGRDANWERIITEIKSVNLAQFSVQRLDQARDAAIRKYMRNRKKIERK